MKGSCQPGKRGKRPTEFRRQFGKISALKKHLHLNQGFRFVAGLVVGCCAVSLIEMVRKTRIATGAGQFGVFLASEVGRRLGSTILPKFVRFITARQ
jgi:hypothetical protein